MNKIKLSTGCEVNLDGDLLALIEAIYEEIALKKELKHTYEDVMGEIENILRQISIEDLRLYFRESLFLNTVTYENEMLNAYIKRLAGKADEP